MSLAESAEFAERRPAVKLNDITGEIVDAALRVHRVLGPGLLETVYEAALAHELDERGLQVQRQVPIPVAYGSVRLNEGFRADLVVQDAVIVELKSVDRVAAVHKKQILTYIRLANRRVGLLLNFGELALRDGITRVVNGLAEP